MNGKQKRRKTQLDDTNTGYSVSIVIEFVSEKKAKKADSLKKWGIIKNWAFLDVEKSQTKIGLLLPQWAAAIITKEGPYFSGGERRKLWITWEMGIMRAVMPVSCKQGVWSTVLLCCPRKNRTLDMHNQNCQIKNLHLWVHKKQFQNPWRLYSRTQTTKNRFERGCSRF